MNIKQKILEEVLKNAVFDGWTETSLQSAGDKLELSDGAIGLAFPSGIRDLVDYHSTWSNQELLERLKGIELDKMRIRDRIAEIVMKKLEVHAPYKDAIASLMKYYIQPQNSFQGLRHLAKTVSLMWYQAGDTSTDFNYYTKRTLLAAVLSSTMIYWLNDKSENNEKTRKFLHDRIENVMKIQKAKASARKFAEKLPFIRKIFS